MVATHCLKNTRCLKDSTRVLDGVLGFRVYGSGCVGQGFGASLASLLPAPKPEGTTPKS